MSANKSFLFSLAFVSFGCAGAPTPKAETPPTAPTSAASEAKRSPPMGPILDDAAAIVPKVPAECPAVVAHPPQAHCEKSLDSLISGLSLGGNAALEALEPLESCDSFPPGYVRALRIELGPPECGDALAAPLVGPNGSLGRGPGRELLVAYGLAARLRRLAADPPPPPGEHTKATLEAYFKNDLFPWITAQASALYAMASEGSKLRGFSRGVVAIEAGMADMRFVEVARAVPVPKEIESDPELRDAYYGALDEALEARKSRGRDAALVGMRDLRSAGVLTDERLTLARCLLSRVFAGGRINALDTLLLPSFPKVKEHTGATRLASLLPVPFSEPLLADQELSSDLVLAYLDRGLPLGVERALSARTDKESKALLGIALLRRGLAYFSAEDFRAAATLLEPAAKAEAPPADLSFAHALAVALSAGPKDAAALILEGPYFAKSLGNLERLDDLGKLSVAISGPARFDGAYLREIAAPPGAPAVWKELETRYKDAAKLLPNPFKKNAEERSAAAKATYRALEKKK